SPEPSVSPIRRAATTAAPLELPARIPSSRARRRVIRYDSLSPTLTISSIVSNQVDSGTKSSPIPSILYVWAFIVSFLEVVLQDRSERVHPDHLDLRILLFEELAHAADRAAGAHPADEVRDRSVRIPPDLRTRRL